MAQVGRPPKLTPEQRAELLQAFRDYIDRSYDPTVVGFCAYDPVAKKYEIIRENIKDWIEFSPLVKRAIEKQEAYLTEGMTRNKLNPTASIFRLKQPQHGWKDRTETDITTAGKELPQPILALPKDVLPNPSDGQTPNAS